MIKCLTVSGSSSCPTMSCWRFCQRPRTPCECSRTWRSVLRASPSWSSRSSRRLWAWSLLRKKLFPSTARSSLQRPRWVDEQVWYEQHQDVMIMIWGEVKREQCYFESVMKYCYLSVTGHGGEVAAAGGRHDDFQRTQGDPGFCASLQRDTPQTLGHRVAWTDHTLRILHLLDQGGHGGYGRRGWTSGNASKVVQQWLHMVNWTW